MSLGAAEVVRRFARKIGEMKQAGETWDKIAETIEEETGETLSVPVLRATYSRIGGKPLKTVAPILAETPKPKPPEKSASEPQIPAVQTPPALIQNDHLIRLVGHRVGLTGWKDFIGRSDLLDRLQNRRKNLYFSRLSDIQPDAPFSHLLTSWTRTEFGRHLAESIDVQKFWKDRVGGDVQTREDRLFAHYNIDRRALFTSIIETLIDDDQSFLAWLLHHDGRGYYNTVQWLAAEVAAGRGGDNINAVINRVSRQVKSAYLHHLELGQAA